MVPSTESMELYADHRDPEQPYRLLVSASPTTSKEILFFLFNLGTNDNGTLPLLVLGLDDSKKAFQDNSFRFINFINTPLMVRFDNEQFRMEPGQTKISKLDLPAGGDFTPFTIEDIEGKKCGYAAFHHRGREMVLIFSPKEGKKRLNIQYFSD